jgi:hypothetical protein
MLTSSFYTLNSIVSILCSTIALIFGIIFVFILITHPTCRSPNNLLVGNIHIVMCFYCVVSIIASVYGFHEDWARTQPLCVFRGYCLFMACVCICYSHLIQSISRLFFTVFYNHKYLLSYRVHWYLIVFNWTIGMLVPIGPLFIANSYSYENESRLCILTRRNFPLAICCLAVCFAIPLGIAFTIYSIIFLYVYRSSRRIGPTKVDSSISQSSNMKRELTLARNMLIIIGIFSGGGIPYLILILWCGLKLENLPPEGVYLPTVTAVSIFGTLMIIALFIMNYQVRNTAFSYLTRCM